MRCGVCVGDSDNENIQVRARFQLSLPYILELLALYPLHTPLAQHPANTESHITARRQKTQDSCTSAAVQGRGAAKLLRSSQCLTLPVRDGAALETTSLLLGWLVQALMRVTALAEASALARERSNTHGVQF